MLSVEWSPLAMLNYSMLNHFTPHSSFYIGFADHSTLHIPHSTFYIGSADHSTLHIPHSTFFIGSADHSTFHIPHSSLRLRNHSTFHIPHSSFSSCPEKKIFLSRELFCCFVLRLQSYYISRQNAIVVRKSWSICTEVAFKLRLS